MILVYGGLPCGDSGHHVSVTKEPPLADLGNATDDLVQDRDSSDWLTLPAGDGPETATLD